MLVSVGHCWSVLVSVECWFTNYVVVESILIAATSASDIAPDSVKEFLDIQASIECRFTLNRVHDLIITYSQRVKYYEKNGFEEAKSSGGGGG